MLPHISDRSLRAMSSYFNSMRHRFAYSACKALLGLLAVASAGRSLPAAAQGIPLIRDTEIEVLLGDYSQTVFKAAGFGGGRVAVRIVNNEAFNAFVVDGRSVYMHTGALMQAETPNEVIGVLAHEAGHIAGGHMAALRARIAKDQTRALLFQILGLGAMIGGAVAGGDSGKEIGSAGQGVMMGGNELIMRSLLGERRSQESAADQAGLQYLNSSSFRMRRRTRSRGRIRWRPTAWRGCVSSPSRVPTTTSRTRPRCSTVTT
jgi:predicted Zn-dependent protease